MKNENKEPILQGKSGGLLNSAEETFFITPDFAPSYSFPYNPDPLCSGNSYRIYDEMMRDDQIKAVLSVKRSLVIGSGWEITCEDEAIKDFFYKNFARLGAEEGHSTFEDILNDVLTCYPYGFSVGEPVFELREGKYILKSLKMRPPHGFKFNIDNFGNIITAEQTAAKGGAIKISPEKLLHVIYQQEFGNPYGLSDLQAAYTAWTSKKHFIKFYNKYVERFASPTIKGEYNPGSDTKDIAAFFSLLKSIQNNTTIAVPKDTPIEFIQASRDTSGIYEAGINMYNMHIARALLVPDLVGISGDKTGGGSYSLGKKQFDIFMGTINRDRLNIQAKINAKIIKPLVAANFGDKVYCEFKFSPYSEKDELENLKMWADVVKARVYKPSDEEVNHYRESINFPTGDVEFEAQQPTPFSDKSQKRLAYAAVNPKRAKLLEKIKAGLDKFEGKYKKEILVAGKDVWQSLIDIYKERNAFMTPEKAFEIQPKYLKPLNVLFKQFFTELFKNSYNDAQAEMFPDRKAVKFADALLPDEFLQLLAAESFSVVGDYVTQLTKKARNILVNGVKRGVGEEAISRLLREELSSVSENWVKTTVRTKATEIFNTARAAYFDQDKDAKQIVAGYEFAAIDDDRISAVCSHLNGKKFEVGEFTDRIRPPLHYNCRSLLIPISRFEDTDWDSPESINNLRDMGANLI